MVIITTGSIGEQLGEMVCGEPGHYFGWSACNCDNLFGNLGNNGSGLIIASDSSAKEMSCSHGQTGRPPS